MSMFLCSDCLNLGVDCTPCLILLYFLLGVASILLDVGGACGLILFSLRRAHLIAKVVAGCYGDGQGGCGVDPAWVSPECGCDSGQWYTIPPPHWPTFSPAITCAGYGAGAVTSGAYNPARHLLPVWEAFLSPRLHKSTNGPSDGGHARRRPGTR